MGLKSEVADADDSRRQNVQQESAQEFVDRQRLLDAFGFVSGIAPAERDRAIDECDESMV